MRDIAELRPLANEIRVCISKSDNYADTARQKIAVVAPALDAGEFGDWNTRQWLTLTVGLDAEKMPLYLPRPGEVAAAASAADPTASSREIAKRTGVSHTTAQRAKREATARGTFVPPEPNGSPDRVTGRDGKSYPAPSPRVAQFDPATSDPHESARKVVDAFRRLPKGEREWAMIEINKFY